MIAFIMHHLAVGLGYGFMAVGGIAAAVWMCLLFSNWSYRRWMDMHRYWEFRRWYRATRPTHGGSDADE